MTVIDVAGRLAEVVGAKRVVIASEELATYAVDEMIPQAIVRPASAEEVAEVVCFAIAEKLAVLPLGSRSKSELGPPLERYDIAIDMSALRSIAHFDPGDLTLSVDAGMPLRELDLHLKEKRQFLPLAVPCFESTTAGGVIASGIDSSLRMQYGSARDFLIGAEFVDGTGQLCRSGGRVVKNVTGYDLHKLLIGSLGTLGAITRLNFRTFPLPPITRGHLVGFGESRDALKYRTTVEKAGLPVANLEVLGPNVGQMVRAILLRAEEKFPAELEDKKWWAYSSFEGNEEVVRRISHDLESIGRETGAIHNRTLQTAEDEALGGMLRESFEWLRWASPLNVICRLALPEIKIRLLDELEQLAVSASARASVLLRAAGTVYFTIHADSEDEKTIESLAKIVSGVNLLARAEQGYATLLQAPLAIKKKIEGFNAVKMDKPTQLKIKQAFDPSGVFAPGRRVGGI
jgi:glycolate oxidase FAD binding subunit